MLPCGRFTWSVLIMRVIASGGGCADELRCAGSHQGSRPCCNGGAVAEAGTGWTSENVQRRHICFLVRRGGILRPCRFTIIAEFGFKLILQRELLVYGRVILI